MDLLSPDFTVVRGRPAYVVDEVDEAVAEVRRLVAGAELRTGGPRQGGFSLSPDQGYDAREVDSWSAAVRQALADRATRPHGSDDGPDDPPELRGVHGGDDLRPAGASGFPPWVRVTALVLVVAVALFFVASYFV